MFRSKTYNKIVLRFKRKKWGGQKLDDVNSTWFVFPNNIVFVLHHISSFFSRQLWSNKLQSLCVALGAVIGLGNVWRFPYIVYAYGGGKYAAVATN